MGERKVVGSAMPWLRSLKSVIKNEAHFNWRVVKVRGGVGEYA